jgi:ABC-2 type transport system ATP-binding protein
MGEALIKASGLSRSFGRSRALSGVSFELGAGSRTALLGPNGAGKSTLLKIMAGALRQDGGAVTVAGRSPEEMRSEPGFLGWLPEGAPLNAELTVLEHLRLTALFRGLGRKRAEDEIGRLADAMDLGGSLDRLTGRLSLGGRRQAALAVALLGEPRLIILDEPSSSLDPGVARRLKALISGLGEGATLVISSHILHEVEPLTGGAVVLGGGEVKAKGSWGGLREALLQGGGAPLEGASGASGLAEDIYFKALGGA